MPEYEHRYRSFDKEDGTVEIPDDAE